MSTATYARFEVLRTFRNRRFFIFSLVFPLTMLPAHRGPNRDEQRPRPGRGSRRRSTTWSA